MKDVKRTGRHKGKLAVSFPPIPLRARDDSPWFLPGELHPSSYLYLRIQDEQMRYTMFGKSIKGLSVPIAFGKIMFTHEK
jgi:hypothetical protein